MSIKNWLAAGLALGTVAGTYTIAKDVGTAIDRRSLDESSANNQKLRQQQEEWELAQEVEKAILGEKIAFKETTLEVLRYAVPLVLVTVMGTTLYLYRGWAIAEVRKAKWQATLVPLDEKTRQYPLIPFEAGGCLRLHNPNTGQTIALDRDSELLPLLAQGSIAVQLRGLLNEGNRSLERDEVPKIIELLKLGSKV